jgi:hypothetical protein
MPAGLLATMLGSSIDAAAPAKAFPSAAALFSRNWKPDPKTLPESAIAAPRPINPIASDLPRLPIEPPILPQWSKKRQTWAEINLVFGSEKGNQTRKSPKGCGRAHARSPATRPCQRNAVTQQSRKD